MWEAKLRKVETSCHPGGRKELWKCSFQVKGRSRRGRDHAVWLFWYLKMKVQIPDSGSSKKPLCYWPLVNEIFWPWQIHGGRKKKESESNESGLEGEGRSSGQYREREDSGMGRVSPVM